MKPGIARLLVAVCLLLTGCAGYRLDAPVSLHMAVPRDTAYDPARAKFPHAFIAGNATGSFSFAGISPEGFRDALSDSFEINGLLASDPARARYRVDIDMESTQSGIFDPTVDTIVRYRLISVGSDNIAFETTLASSATQAFEKRNPLIYMLIGLSAVDQDTSRTTADAHFASARNNIRAFFTELSLWQVSDTTTAPATTR